jgi:transcriptional regulator of aromatic amino acid metabolism
MKISKARLKEIIKEEVRLHQNEGVGAYLDNDIKNLVQRATRDYEISTEEVALAFHAAARELEGNVMNESIEEESERQIEAILNTLFDEGASNKELKELLLKVIENIDAGFVGEPS